MDSHSIKFNGSSRELSSSGLLINVIRTLTSSVSDDQRQLERSRLEKGYEESGLEIDQLLQKHQNDVGKCLTSFRKVSVSMRSCREQIKNVKNALVTCKSLLQCRRDDLKKLWAETAEQKYLSKILSQIHEIKHIDQNIEKFVTEDQYRKAVDCLKQADILLNGPLSSIDGLSQLRTNVSTNIQTLFEKIVSDLLQCIVVIPFECQIIELMKGLNETTLSKVQVCVKLLNKYMTLNAATAPVKPSIFAIISQWSNRLNNVENSQFNIVTHAQSRDQDQTNELIKNKVVECLEALKVFDQLDSAVSNIFLKSPALCFQSVNDTIEVLRLFICDGVSDLSHLAQLCQLLIYQILECANRFSILLQELTNFRSDKIKKWSIEMWNILQNILELVVSEHLDIWQPDSDKNREEQRTNTKLLFSFENTSFIASAISSHQKKQCFLICTPNPYNISAIFQLLNRFSNKVEQELGNEVCKFNTFLHTFVMDTFIEKVRVDFELKMESILKGPDVWSSLSLAHNAKVLTSCAKIFELCDMVNEFIKKMGSYTQRFAALWLLIIASYIKSATDMYTQIIRARNHQNEQFVDFPKISAAWAVDEDISRLMKSLPQWLAIRYSTSHLQFNTGETSFLDSGIESGGIVENEQEIRQSIQRESEILIGNLGTQKQIQRDELITDMEHVKSLVCIHESFQWFASSMRNLIKNLPESAQNILNCRIQISDTENGESVEQLLNEALTERLNKIDSMAETCLLMIYLEIRIHCFYHLLPLTQFRGDLQEDQDLEISEFGRDLMQYNQTLSAYIIPKKLKYLFNGLGYLCASIFIHTSQYINKLSDQDRKWVCRKIFTVQKCLSQLSGKPEIEINRALTFYKLVNMDIEQIFAMVKESGESYSYIEYTYLLSLVVRSHTVLSSQPGALEAILSQLRDNLSKTN